MTFHTNHPILFILAGILIAVVLGQSIYFLVKAMKRSKEIGMDQTKIRKTIKTAAIFTIAPAVSIVISVITLAKSLGIPLPWLRLSVVGSLSYEAIAASNAVSAMGLELGKISELTLILWVEHSNCCAVHVDSGCNLLEVHQSVDVYCIHCDWQWWIDILDVVCLMVCVGVCCCDECRHIASGLAWQVPIYIPE